MIIRKAEEKDISQISKLLYQVNQVHADKRPDLFISGEKKYSNEELKELLKDSEKPIFVAVDGEVVWGYAFCALQKHDDVNWQKITTLYIDDLCVDENTRGQSVGKKLYDYVIDFAKEINCYNVTLNVWEGNDSAKKFYEKCGMKVQKTGMETIL